MEIALLHQDGVNLWFGKAIGKLRVWSRLSNGAGLLKTSFKTKSFQDTLMSLYSDSYESIQSILQVLLLRSQLGPALNKELQHLEYSGFLSAKTAASIENFVTKHGISRRQKPRLKSAAYAATEVLTQGKIQGMAVNKSWEVVWETTWEELQVWQMALILKPAISKASASKPLPSSDPPTVPYSIKKAMKLWKNEWDRVNKWSVQYMAIVTETITSNMMEQLTDIDPEQTVFGNDTPCCSDAGSRHPKGLPSLQEFICGRMQDHFDMVDRFGFGLFQELMMRAKEATCEIWVASLDIMESGRFRSQHGGAGPSIT